MGGASAEEDKHKGMHATPGVQSPEVRESPEQASAGSKVVITLATPTEGTWSQSGPPEESTDGFQCDGQVVLYWGVGRSKWALLALIFRDHKSGHTKQDHLVSNILNS